MSHARPTRHANRRMLAGLLVVPPAIGLLTFAGFLGLHGANGPEYTGRLTAPVRAAIGAGLAVGILAGVVVVAGALPGVLWLAARGPLSLRRLLLLGAVLGNVPLVLIILVATAVNLAAGTPERGADLYDPLGTVARVAVGLACGLTGASVFWLVGVRGTELEDQSETE